MTAIRFLLFPSLLFLTLAACSNEPVERRIPLLRSDTPASGAHCEEVCAESYPPQCFTVCDDGPVDGGDDPVACTVIEICAESYPPMCRTVCVEEDVPADECDDVAVFSDSEGESVTVCVDDGEPGAAEGSDRDSGVSEGGETEEPGHPGDAGECEEICLETYPPMCMTVCDDGDADADDDDSSEG